MNDSIKNLRASISNIKPGDLIYPGIFLVFILIVGILFFTSTRFITKNINNAFSEHVGGSEGSLNIPNYTLVANKLGISLTEGNPSSAQNVIPETAIIATTTPTSTVNINKKK